jgi:hypothetical protein
MVLRLGGQQSELEVTERGMPTATLEDSAGRPLCANQRESALSRGLGALHTHKDRRCQQLHERSHFTHIATTLLMFRNDRNSDTSGEEFNAL